MLLRFAHVLLAIVAIGANLTYALWRRFGERHPEHLAYTIRGIRAIDRRAANPASLLARRRPGERRLPSRRRRHYRSGHVPPSLTLDGPSDELAPGSSS